MGFPEVRLRGAVPAIALWLALLLAPAAAWAGDWLEPVSASDPSWSGSVARDVAIDPNGNAMALVTGQLPAGSALAAVSWPAGQPPAQPKSLTSAPVLPDQAQVAMDAQGNTVVVWIETTGSGVGKASVVRARFKPAGEDWRAARDVHRLGLGDEVPSKLRLAMSANGVAVAVWTREDGTLQAVVKPAGGTAFGPVSNLSPVGSIRPDLAVDPNGNAVVVWQESGGAQAAARPAGGSFAPLGTVSGPGENGYYPRVAMDAQGRAIAMWRSASDGPLKAATRGTSGDFGAPELVAEEVDSETEIVMDRDGTAVAVWRRPDWHEPGVVRSAVRPWGGSFSAPRDLATTSAPYFGSPAALAMAADGTAMVSFNRVDGVLQSSVLQANGGFAPPQDVERSPHLAAEPMLAMNGDGHAVTIWTAGSGAATAFRMARFDHDAQNPNQIQNAGFEPDLAEWNTSGSAAGISLTREAGGHSGGWAAKLTNTAATAGTCTLNDVPLFPWPTAAGTYTASLWVRAEAPGQTLKLRLREYNGGTLAGSQTTQLPLSTAWQRATVSYTPTAPASSTLDLNAYVSGAAPGTCFLADDASLVLEAEPPPPPPPPPDQGLFGNGSFETDLAGWNTSGSAAGVSLTREAGGHTGGWAARLANTAATAGTCALNDAPNAVAVTAAGTYTATLWVRAEAPGQTLKLRLREYNGGTLAGSHTEHLTVSTAWQQATVSYTPTAPGSSTLDFSAYVSGAAPGTCFLADDASIALDGTPPPPPPPPPPANDFPNPGFEPGLAGWNTSGSATGVSLTREAGGHTGGWAARLANTAATAGTCMLNDTPNAVAKTAAGTYTATLWVRAEAPGQTLKLRLREYDGGRLAGSETTQLALTTAWQQASVTYTPAAPGSSTLDFNAYVSGAAPGTCFLADDASIHRG
jgi:Carbohydrate binding domain